MTIETTTTDPLNGPAAIVQDKYDRSIGYANAAAAQVAAMQDAFNNSLYAPATISVEWQSLPAPDLPAVPAVPQAPTVSFTLPTGMPGALDAQLDDVEIDDFDVTIPELNFGTAPVVSIGQVPALPQLDQVAIPVAPTVILPDAPEFLQMTTHTFAGVDMHESWLTKLSDIPELSLLEPAPFSYSPGERYSSDLLSKLKDMLNARLNGGTGLAASVEQQIWDRSRDRETQLALAREQEVLRSSEALGFPLPSGVMAGQLADARRDYLDKLAGLSRDISIKQAELEQSNLKESIQFALQLETTLLDDAYKFEALAFEYSKTAADNAIAIHNAAAEKFKALLAGYQAYSAAYETIIKAELSKIEVFKALLASEETKASINRSLVERHKAEIEACMTAVEIYKARVGAAQTLVELERTKIQAGGEQIKAFVATVNAETSKLDLHKQQIQAEGMKVQAIEAVSRAYSAKTSAQAEKARLGIAKYQALNQAKALEWDGWRAKLQAEVSKMDAAARQTSIIYDGYKLGAQASETQAAMLMRRWESDIRQYEASQNITMQQAKINADAVTHANDARLEASKLGMAAAAQRLASAWSMVSASASISGGVTQSITSSATQ